MMTDACVFQRALHDDASTTPPQLRRAMRSAAPSSRLDDVWSFLFATSLCGANCRDVRLSANCATRTVELTHSQCETHTTPPIVTIDADAVLEYVRKHHRFDAPHGGVDSHVPVVVAAYAAEAIGESGKIVLRELADKLLVELDNSVRGNEADDDITDTSIELYYTVLVARDAACCTEKIVVKHPHRIRAIAEHAREFLTDYDVQQNMFLRTPIE